MHRHSQKINTCLLAFRYSLAVGLMALGGADLNAEPKVDGAELPRLPPTEPADALATFRVKPGFKIEQVAAEPLVSDPVAIAFDERGRLFVAEMRGYSERRDDALGRIRLLTDTDRDGYFDHSVVFADGLRWPTGLICWRGGVFVVASPDILYCPDADEDGRADSYDVVFTGFGAGKERLNVQALPNSLTWGPDNRIHGATAMNGGQVRRPGSSVEVPLNGRDFSFDPLTLDLRPENGGGQYGMAFDSFGRKFVCSNSNHIQWIVYQAKFNDLNLPPPRVDIPVDGPSAEVFRTSPDEPWRVIRTRWRVGGKVRGPVEGGGRSSGYFTAATGITLYRGHIFPEEFADNAFVCDAGSNLVHRKIVRRSANRQLLEATRAKDEQDSEFLTSSDNWFRPVQATNGPDGALYIVDMYREIIEHPWSLPETIKKHLDLNSGNDRGRIYRIVPQNFEPQSFQAANSEDPLTLAKGLAHPNGWQRDTSARLIVDRRPHGIVSKIGEVARSSELPAGRKAALQALASLRSLQPADLLTALRDPSATVRRHAVSLSIDLGDQSVHQLLRSLVVDSDPEVALVAGLAVSGTNRNRVGRVALVSLLEKHPDVRWIREVALSGLKGDPTESVTAILSSTSLIDHPPIVELVRALIADVPKPLPEPLTQQVKDLYTRIEEPPVQAALVAISGIKLSQNDRSQLEQRLLGQATNSSEHPGHRVAAIRELPRLLGSESLSALASLLTASEPPEIQQVAVTAIGDSDLPGGGTILRNRWPRLSPSLHRVTIAQFFRRQSWREPLLDGLESGVIPPVLLQPHQIDALRNSGPTHARERAARLLVASTRPNKRDQLLAYEGSLKLKGIPAGGRDIFRARCATCHRKANLGTLFGPDVATFQNAGPESILGNLIDPNREVQPRYATVVIETDSGSTHTGYLVGESNQTVTIREIATGDRSILRSNISRLRTLGASPMPEGLEVGLTQQQMADLLAFITEG